MLQKISNFHGGRCDQVNALDLPLSPCMFYMCVVRFLTITMALSSVNTFAETPFFIVTTLKTPLVASPIVRDWVALPKFWVGIATLGITF